MNKRVVAMILARGGSKGIPKKNLTNLAGKPLMQWTIEQVQDCGITDIFVSTDDQDIADFALGTGVEVVQRPRDLATDTSSSDDALIHALNKLEIPDDFIVTMPQVTSPLRTAEHIINSVDLVSNGNFDSVFSGVQIDDICVWSQEKELRAITYDHKNRLIRQVRPKMYVENGSIYSMRAGLVRATKNRLSGRIGVSVMPKWTLTEIDDLDDLELCEHLMKAYVNEF